MMRHKVFPLPRTGTSRLVRVPVMLAGLPCREEAPDLRRGKG
ncbi:MULTISPECIES: hypothetical protein [Parasaccharibacter]|nr:MULTISPECIES: hypothetical protein [Parasaccharibacter]